MNNTEQLQDLIRHMYIHDGYAWNGFEHMTSEQKKLYLKVINTDLDFVHTEEEIWENIRQRRLTKQSV